MSDPVGTAGAVQYYVNSSTFGGDSSVLHIDTTDSNLTLARSAAASELTIKRTSTYTGTNSLGNLIFDFAGDSVAGMGASRDGADDAAALQLFTQATGGANTERMRITSAGDVGIGTTAPIAKLDVDLAQTSGDLTAASSVHFGSQSHTTSEIMGITLGYREASADYRKIGLVAAGLGDAAARQDFHILVDTVSASGNVGLSDSKFMIDGLTGYIGIGTDSPSSKLHVEGGQILTKNASGDASIKVWAGGSSDPRIQFTVDSATDYVIGLDNSDGDALKFCRSSAVGTSTQMTITSDGRVDVDSILQTGLLYHNVLQFFHNGTISNGVKIKTNFPFDSANENAMPTIIIEGYDYRGGRTIGLQIAWYPYASSFYQGTVSSFGSYTPVVKLARESDKVIIHLGTDETDWYYDSFNVRVLHNFVNSDQSSELIGWTWADEAITGDRIATLTYNNKVGNLIAEGNVGIGTSSLSYPLTVTEGSSSIAFAEYSSGANIWLDGVNGDFSGGDYYNILADGNTALRFGYGGSTKVSMLSNGYFGIGDGTPSRPLCVKHSNTGTLAAIKIENTSSGDASIWFKETGSEWIMGLDNSDSNSFKISNSSELGSSDMLTIDTNGNVGIGVSSPLNAGLTISTNSATLTLNDTGFSGYSWTFDQNSGDGSLRIIKSDETTGSTVDTPLAILGTGLVGVGKTAPAYALDVDGIVNCTSLRFADGTSISTTPTGTVLLRDLNPAAFNYDMHVAGQVGIGSTSPAAKLVVEGNSDAGDSTCAIHIIDNDSTSGSAVPNISFRSGASTQIYQIRGNDTLGLQFRKADDGTVITFDTNGDVGIGATSPGSFHSSGNRLVIGDGSGEDGLTIYSGSSSNGVINFADVATTGSYQGRIMYDHSDNAMSFHGGGSGAEMMRITSDGSVGIGTASPAFKTEIVGDTLAIHDGAGEGSGRILFDEQSNGTYGFSLGYAAVGNKSFDGTDDGYPTNVFFIARHNNSKNFINVMMSNRDNGHIGFGSGWGSGSSVYANSFLHSKGPERLGSDMYASATKLGLIVEDTTGSASHKITGMVDVEHNPTGKTISRICTSRSDLGSRIFFLTSNNYSNGVNHNPLTLNYDGRIGLNDTSPNATIDVYQSASHSTNDIRLRRSTNHSTWASWSYNGATCYFGTAGDDPLGFKTNSTERMRIAENGNVGVATASPAYKLDVNGTVRCNTLIFKDGTSFSSVGAVGNKAIAVNVGNGSSNPEGRAKSVVDATYGGIQNGLVLVYYYYNYSSHCGNGGCTRTAYRKRAYQVVDGNWTSIFDF